MRGSFLALWTAAVLATVAAFVVHLALRFETVRLGYAVGAERRERQRLTELKRLLAIEAATLRDAVRLESHARTRLHMVRPDPDAVVVLRQRPAAVTASASGRAAGRPR
ncbi:MAG: cell division protein FtsL [Polyangiales bacterium]